MDSLLQFSDAYLTGWKKALEINGLTIRQSFWALIGQMILVYIVLCLPFKLDEQKMQLGMRGFGFLGLSPCLVQLPCLSFFVANRWTDVIIVVHHRLI